MADLKFADTHNLVTFLSKPAESEGFEQIVDFLNANPINYALTVNPTIYTSCIEHFWSNAKAKTVNGEVQLQALVDGKKIIVTEASVRSDLQLNDEEGMDCFPNATIFEELARMGYEKLSQKLTFYKAFFSPQWKFLIHTILQCLSAKTTAWNEFSSTMASAIICLATNQKLNFSKYIFENMVKNLDNVNKFLMYPRFVQVFVNQQVGDMSHHKRIYVTPSHTKKIVGNMKREGKGFSGRETPLFPTMMKKQKPRKPKRKDTEVPQPSGPTTNVADEAVNEENVSKHSNDPLLSSEDSIKLKELMDFCTKLQQIVGRSARVVSSDEASLGDQEDASKQGRKIDDIDKDAEDMAEKVINVAKKEVSTDDPVTTAGEVVTTASVEVSTASPTKATIANELTLAQTLIEIKSAKPKVKRVVIGEQSESTTKTRPQQLPSKDKGKGIMEEPGEPTKKKDQIRLDEELAFRVQAEEVEEANIEADHKKRAEEKRNRPPTKVQKRNIMSTYLENMAGYKHNQLKNKSFDDIQKLFDKDMKRINTFIDMDTELVEESSKRTEITQESSSKRAGDKLEQERIKKQKIDEDKESA
ncbi:hypothetical protein Tco_1163032 [Tanacetum coccineum]